MKTPAAPPESRPRPMPRQALQGTLRFLCFGFRCSETVADRFIVIDEAALDFGECGLPCGLHASLCTLRMFCSAIGHYGQYLRHTRNTRYGWWARPYPMGTSTPQEASNFLALVAVGTSVTRRPPLRSRRAEFPHRALRKCSPPQSAGEKRKLNVSRLPSDSRFFNTEYFRQSAEFFPMATISLTSAV
jgi:hypothetical protein